MVSVTPGFTARAELPDAKAGSQCIALLQPGAASSAGLTSPPRLRHKLALLQQQCEEKQQLFQTLQSELQIYEALYGNSKKGLKGVCSPRLPCPVASYPC